MACYQDQVVARVAMRTPEECLDAWRYIRPYAEGIAHDKKALGRLQGAQPHFRGMDAFRHVSQKSNCMKFSHTRKRGLPSAALVQLTSGSFLSASSRQLTASHHGHLLKDIHFSMNIVRVWHAWQALHQACQL